jgi:NAD(P)H-dependent flavin oxidoreductase YrpB (nitropropane dioxygenase family)
MPTEICRKLGLQFPIFAFSHCRDVVVAVSKAGGIGVYGGALHTPEQVRIDLSWIERRLGGAPYGVDLLLAQKYISASEEGIARQIPDGHRVFLDGVMERYQVPDTSAKTDDVSGLLGATKFTPEQNAAVLDVVFEHNARIFVSALGTPSAEIIGRARAKGMLVGALAGNAKHALRHKAAGLDFVVASAYEAGGHTGEIGSMVLIPDVVDAVEPMPVLAAGGIGRGRQMAAALALGAQGVWCGSIWLASVESDVLPLVKEKLIAADATQSVRTRCFTGKPARFLKSAWSEEWEKPEAPSPLPAPLQTALISTYMQRISAAAASGKATANDGPGQLISSPVGQIVGSITSSLSSRDIVRNLVEEMAETVSRLGNLFEEAG